MTGLSQGASALYFGYQPVAGHFEGCPLRGTDTWEVTRFQDRRLFPKDDEGEIRETVLRYACHECGSVTFERYDGEASSFEHTSAEQVGYASKPEKVAGLWLHPGPRILYYDERGPWTYYVTRTKDRPRRPEDTAGTVGWHLGRRGGVKWGAGLGCSDHSTVTVRAEQEFTSRRAAVAWIAAQLTVGGAS